MVFGVQCSVSRVRLRQRYTKARRKRTRLTTNLLLSLIPHLLFRFQQSRRVVILFGRLVGCNGAGRFWRLFRRSGVGHEQGVGRRFGDFLRRRLEPRGGPLLFQRFGHFGLARSQPGHDDTRRRFRRPAQHQPHRFARQNRNPCETEMHAAHEHVGQKHACRQQRHEMPNRLGAHRRRQVVAEGVGLQ